METSRSVVAVCFTDWTEDNIAFINLQDGFSHHTGLCWIRWLSLHQTGHVVVDVRFWNISACIVRHMSPSLSLKRRYIDSSLVKLAILSTNRPILSSKSFESRPRQSTPEQWFIDLEIEQWKHHQQGDNPMMQPYRVGTYVKLHVLSQPTYNCKTKDDTQWVQCKIHFINSW